MTVLVAPGEPAEGASARAPALPLVMFFVLAYALSWAWWLPIALDGGSVERGDAWPTQVPGLLGPLFAALIVLALTEGRAGVRPWPDAMARWPRERRWQLARGGSARLPGARRRRRRGDRRSPTRRGIHQRHSGTAASAGALPIAVIVNVFGEEAGWRGYALPRLQSRLGPMRATLLLAALWAGWHAPLFLILASYGDFGPLVLPGFFIGLTAGALVLTSLYNRTGAASWSPRSGTRPTTRLPPRPPSTASSPPSPRPALGALAGDSSPLSAAT